jgi:CHAD domain-containing protein
MAWRFEAGEELPQAFRRVAKEESARIEAGLAKGNADPEAAIHEARQGFKRLRALLRLGRDALGRDFDVEDRRWRDAARLLAHSRQEAALRKILDHALAKCDGIAPTDATRLRAAIDAECRKPLPLPARDRRILQAALRAGRRRIDELAWPETPADLGDGVKASAARLRKRWRKARVHPDAEALHALRKRIKDHASHLRLMRSIAPGIVLSRRDACKAVAELLGDERDLGLLAERLAGAGIPAVVQESRDALLRYIKKRRKKLLRRAMAKTKAIQSEAPRTLSASLSGVWTDAALRRTVFGVENGESRDTPRVTSR